MSDGRVALDKLELERSKKSLNEYTMTDEQWKEVIEKYGPPRMKLRRRPKGGETA